MNGLCRKDVKHSEINFPRLAMGTMRQFYEYNNVSKSLLYKESNLRVTRVLIPASDETGPYDRYEIPKDDPEHIVKLRHLRRSKRFSEFSDQQLLYLVNAETMKVQEGWS
jgi:hypothetical protein